MSRRTNARRIVAVAAALATFVAAPFALAHRAIGGQRPTDVIDLAVPEPIQPGQTLDCTVSFASGTGATNEPTHVVIYSEPAGVVSYEGDVTGSTVTVPATTSGSAPSGSVTVYATTDGQQVVGTDVAVATGSVAPLNVGR
jgi:hypothetical protein